MKEFCKITIPQEIVTKYDRPGPRYTSYPTAPVWTAKFGPNEYASALKHSSTQALKHLSLYFHIPFCEYRCHYCGCSTIATRHHEVSRRYIETLGREIALAADSLGEKHTVSQLHFGGGTPTYLSCKEIEKLWGEITKHFTFAEDAEIGIEIDPRVTSAEQLNLLHTLGFNRISLGVQDFSPTVQKAIGRIEPLDLVSDMVELCRSLGFKSVNMDLIYGLPHQTPESFKSTVEKIIALSPDRIACFNFAYLPQMLPHQRILPVKSLPDGKTKFTIFCRAIEQFCTAGYDFIGMDHFAKAADELSLAAKNKTLWRNFQGYTTKSGTCLVAFGLTAISDVGGCYAQNAKKLMDYYGAIESDSFATVRGWKLSEDDLARRAIIRNLFCNGCADISKVCHPCESRDDKIYALEQDGLIQRNGGVIQVTPLGRLFVRNIAMVFDRYLNDGEVKFSRTV